MTLRQWAGAPPLTCKPAHQPWQRLPAGGARPRDAYGAEHLVRLVARLPAVCALLRVTEEEAAEAAAAYGDLVRFLDRLLPTLLPEINDM